MHRALAAVALLSSALGLACYDYRPITTPSAMEGRRVQLYLTDSGAVALARSVGPSVEALEGTFMGDSAGAYQLAMSTSRTRNGVETDWRGERVFVPRPLVATMLERRFSSSRTVFATGLAALGVGAVTVGLRGKGEGGGGGPIVTPGSPK
jgi:hypothetical protein